MKILGAIIHVTSVDIIGRWSHDRHALACIITLTTFFGCNTSRRSKWVPRLASFSNTGPYKIVIVYITDVYIFPPFTMA